ncbi:hypothetical protein HYPSUDRAFT_204718 [Hypholoma sublateritium FD-334 SS-4]|uniref:Uncharacterized protein n=1 Tax=Hypholoma sublateritium (strain FD-334 SS-4) TaxID=945553 RepID=A0A0D2NKA6_HYPSF|nr:hypothetical protein HYPSUDRAFT_204718 [Hypholoma sublateritium FD-334 SS-4]
MAPLASLQFPRPRVQGGTLTTYRGARLASARTPCGRRPASTRQAHYSLSSAPTAPPTPPPPTSTTVLIVRIFVRHIYTVGRRTGAGLCSSRAAGTDDGPLGDR